MGLSVIRNCSTVSLKLLFSDSMLNSSSLSTGIPKDRSIACYNRDIPPIYCFSNDARDNSCDASFSIYAAINDIFAKDRSDIAFQDDKLVILVKKDISKIRIRIKFGYPSRSSRHINPFM